jgi:N-acetylglutamate synthase
VETDVRMIHLLEELAANAWPAHVQQTLGKWRLRATFGITKRANSVFTVGPFPDHDEWIKVVEDFYQQRSIPACFYISDVSPVELDGMLEALGYGKVDECYMMAAKSSDCIERVDHDSRFTCRFASEADDEWIRDFIRFENFAPERHHGYAHIFSAIRPEKTFARICENGETVGLGTVVVERGWACLSNIVVAPAHRRRGIGVQLVGSLAGWARANGANGLYLQVVKENLAAVNVYTKLGFVPVSGHHYRIRPTT